MGQDGTAGANAGSVEVLEEMSVDTPEGEGTEDPYSKAPDTVADSTPAPAAEEPAAKAPAAEAPAAEEPAAKAPAEEAPAAEEAAAKARGCFFLRP